MPAPDDARDWDAAARRAMARPYLDPLVAAAKRADHLRLLSAWLPSMHGRRLLKTDLWEEGVAGDELLFTLGRHAAAVHGIDVSERVVTAARSRAAREGVPADLRVADIRATPFPDASVDTVVSTSTIDHLADLTAFGDAINELARVLAPAGVLVITADNGANLTDWLLRLAHRLGRVPFPLGPSVQVAALERLVRAAGLTPTAVAYLVPAPRVLATILVRVARLLPERLADRGVHALLGCFAALGRRSPRRTACFVAIRAEKPAAGGACPQASSP